MHSWNLPNSFYWFHFDYYVVWRIHCSWFKFFQFRFVLWPILKDSLCVLEKNACCVFVFVFLLGGVLQLCVRSNCFLMLLKGYISMFIFLPSSLLWQVEFQSLRLLLFDFLLLPSDLSIFISCVWGFYYWKGAIFFKNIKTCFYNCYVPDGL